MKRRIFLVGGGGHCLSCIDVITAGHAFSIAGILDKKENVGKTVGGYPVIGTDDDLPGLVKKNAGAAFFITVGQVRSPEVRVRIFEQLKNLKARLPVIISPFAVVSENAHIDEGTIVMHGAIVNNGAVIGANCIINSRALVEHESTIGGNSHIATGAIVNGQCKVGKNVFIGSGAVLVNNASVADGSVIGAGSIVIRDITEKGTYAGNPARRIH